MLGRVIGRLACSAVIAATCIIAGHTAEATDVGTTGTATPGQFRNPLNGGADPGLKYAEGQYHLLTTQGDAIRMWSSASLAGLLTAPAQTLFVDSDPSRNQQVWAPNFRFMDGHWYIYYTASDGVDANHRNYVIESDGSSITGPYHFMARIADQGSYAIDGEPIKVNGNRYFAWSSPGRGYPGGPQQIYLQQMDTPWSTTGPVVALPVDTGMCDEVREGPTPLHSNGRVYLTYSTCDTGKPDYAIYMISIPETSDPMVPSNWTTHPDPILSRNDAASVWGPGHHSFFRSPDGSEVWISYHAKNTSTYTYSWRTTRVQRVDLNTDGSPAVIVPQAQGATMDLPSGDPGLATAWINDTDEGTGDLQVSYTGTWSSGTGCAAQCFFGNDHWSSEVGATATFHFTGKQIALLSVRDVGNGIAGISIDGGAETFHDYYGDPRVGESLQYISPVLEAGPHTLTVRVTGDHNASASAAVISIDRAEVYS